MGYTEYFAFLPDHPTFVTTWPQMVADARRIVDHARDEHGIAVGDGDEGHVDADTSEKTGIWVNGITPDVALETLWIPGPGPDAHERIRTQRGWFGDVDYVWMFAKTGRLPYDTIVCAILLRCRVLCPRAFAIGSDGAWGREWRCGAWDGCFSPRALYRELFGDGPQRSPLVDATRGPPAATRRMTVMNDPEPL
jgi:hypothetical protein